MSPWIWVLGGALATLTILSFIFAVQALVRRPFPTLQTTKLMTVMPLAITGLALVFQTAWARLARWSDLVLDSRFLIGEQALVLILLMVPFAGLSAVSWFKPIFNARGMLLFAPYLLLVIARGIERLGRHGIVAALLLVLLSAAHYTGLKDYRHMAIGRADYKALATSLAPHIEEDELIFFRAGWYGTPILYYLNSDWDRFVGYNYEIACLQNPHARVWALWFYNYEESFPEQMEEALWNYRAIQTIEAPGARAVLYAPKE